MTTQPVTPRVRTIWKLDPAHSSVDFSVKHMVISTVKGHFGKFDVDVDLDEAAPENSRVAAHIGVASIDTKDEKRDAHLRSADFFEVERYPAIEFHSRRVELKGGGRARVVGDLTIRGVTREVVLDTTFSGVAMDPWGNQHAGFSAETSINRKDFGLTWNMALETGGVLVGDTIKISIEAEFVQQR